jgi:hypothetical protein
MANGLLDTMIGLRVLYLLVQPITGLPAYKLGLVSETGAVLRKAKTPEEKRATSMLLRLVLRIRNFLSNIPMAQSKLGSYASAYALVRECIDQDNFTPATELLEHLIKTPIIIDENMLEHLNLFNEINESEISYLLNNQIIMEDIGAAPTNATGPATSTDKPVVRKRKSATFQVSDQTFGNFKNGKTKFRRWGHYLNMEDSTDQMVFDYARKHPKGILVLKDQKGNARGIRYSKSGGGNWHGINRKPKQVVECFLNEQEYEMEVFEL